MIFIISSFEQNSEKVKEKFILYFFKDNFYILFSDFTGSTISDTTQPGPVGLDQQDVPEAEKSTTAENFSKQSVRPRRTSRKPAKFDDMYLYHIFE